ncbi:hypothetical protein ACIBCO_00610 [Streptomyces violascens]
MTTTAPTPAARRTRSSGAYAETWGGISAEVAESEGTATSVTP